MAFRFDWVHKNDGFDPNPDTPWLMVPQNGFKEIKLPGLNNNLANFTWKCSPSDAIGWGAAGGDKLFVFGGTKTGLVRLEARNSAGEVAKLDVSVKKRHTYVIQAFRANAGRFLSDRSFTSLQFLVDEANEVLKPQTNQFFVLIPNILPLDMGKNFGAVIAEREFKELSIEANQACWDKNVIPLVLVRELEYGSPSTDVEGVTWNDVITIEDDIARNKNYVLAHELGHFLTLDHIPNQNGLMYATSPRGKKLYKRECNTMNQTGLF